MCDHLQCACSTSRARARALSRVIYYSSPPSLRGQRRVASNFHITELYCIFFLPLSDQL